MMGVLEEKPQQFRKLPVVIEAMQWTTWYSTFVCHWLDSEGVDWHVDMGSGDDVLVLPTLEGDMQASPGDWIIKGVAGEFYPCKPDIFSSTYECEL